MGFGIGILVLAVVFAVATGLFVSKDTGGVTQISDVGMGCRSDLKMTQMALGVYFARNQHFPPNLNPALTRPPHNLLRPQPGLSGNTLTEANYTITYDPQTGTLHASTSMGSAGCP